MARMLDSHEAARRLGIKVGTLYAYVSRGLLASHPEPGSRRSLFDLDDIERLAARAGSGRRVEARLATVTTSVTQLRPEGPVYRGVPATRLAADGVPYEAVAELLWGDAGRGADPGAPWEALPLGDRPDLGASDRLRWAVVLAGAANPLRSDLRPESVTRTARRLVATMVDALPGAGPAGGGIAGRLARHLADRPSPALEEAVGAALVLLADHELATSTVAVRVAASTRADLCDAVLAGLGTLAGPLHGGASRLAYGLLVDAERDGPERALDETLRWQGVLPGFGHTVYVDGDPRFGVLLARFEALATPGQRRLVAAMVDLAADHGIPPPNVDLALAAVTLAADLPPDAGRTLFTVARVAGWTAHYLEELRERPLRFRARAVYAAEPDGDGPSPAARPGPTIGS
jgi:citrate synthase